MTRFGANIHDQEEPTKWLAIGLLKDGTEGFIELKEHNQSGFSGAIRVNYKENDNILFTFGKPDLLTWRLNHLRHLWQQQDALNDPYTNGELPVIDPDVIGPEDFRLVSIESGVMNVVTPYMLWKKRRKWVDDRLKTMMDIRFPDMGGTKPEDKIIMERLLAQMNQPIGYRRYDAQGFNILIPAWQDPVTIKELAERRAALKNGREKDSQNTWIKKHFLSVESFTRLAEIAGKVLDEETVTEAEWIEVESILVQAKKLLFRRDWIAEKVPVGPNFFSVTLDPKHFWKALSEPEEGAWTPALKAKPAFDRSNGYFIRRFGHFSNWEWSKSLLGSQGRSALRTRLSYQTSLSARCGWICQCPECYLPIREG